MNEGLHPEDIPQLILAPWAAKTNSNTVGMDVFNKLSRDSERA